MASDESTHICTKAYLNMINENIDCPAPGLFKAHKSAVQAGSKYKKYENIPHKSCLKYLKNMKYISDAIKSWYAVETMSRLTQNSINIEYYEMKVLLLETIVNEKDITIQNQALAINIQQEQVNSLNSLLAHVCFI